MLATIPITSPLDQVKLCRDCFSHGSYQGRPICLKQPHKTLAAARSDCRGAWWRKRLVALEPSAPDPEGLVERVEGTVTGIRLIQSGEGEALQRAQARIAELETCLLVTVEAHERRVVELLTANNRMKDARVEAGAERDAWRATAEALARSLIAAQAERDSANLALQEAAREIGDQSMTLDEGTESR